MGRKACIEMNCSRYSSDIMKVIELLEKNGWRVCDSNDRIAYLPIGDKDNYAWECKSITLDELCKIVNKKQTLQEMIGVALYYEQSECGITFLAKSTEEIILELDINRKTLGTTRESITDVGWYFSNIINRITEKGCLIDYIRFTEYSD